MKDKFYLLKKNTLVKNSSLVFFLRILGMLLSYASMILISNIYGAEVFGKYSLSITILQLLLVLFSLGLTQSVVKLTADANFFSDFKPQNQYLIRSIVILFITSLVCSILFYSFRDVLAIDVFKDNSLSSYFKAIAVFFVFAAFHMFLSEFIRGRKKFKEYGVFMYVLPNLIFICLLIIFRQLGYINDNITITSYLIGISIISVILIFYLPLKDLNNNVLYSNKDLLRLSFPMMFSAFFIFITNWTDILMLGMMVSKEEVGVYNAAYKLAIIVLIVINAVNTVLGPKIAELFGNQDHNRIKEEVQSATKLITILSVPVCLILILFRKFFLGLFGDDFISGEIVLIVFSSGLLINASLGSVALVLNMTNYQNTLRKFTLISATINILLNYFLIKKYGINGAAFASVISAVGMNITCTIFIKKKFGFYTFFRG